MANSGSFAKGDGRTRKKKGDVHKLTRTAKEAFQATFDKLGGVEGLYEWAKSNDKAKDTFYSLYARLIPTDVNATVKTVDVDFIG